MMEGFGVQPNNNKNQQPFDIEVGQKRERLTADEIAGQLNITGPRYEEELEKLRSENGHDELWIATYQDNLIHWMNDMRISEGVLKRGNDEVLEEIEHRLYMLSEEIEKTIH